ncbi:MAG: OsmC family protein [Alistipes senegalensis]|nr:OsmC family protein [Oxalobacter formigenes]MCM1280474.1 OsmC family protein [Alistipes senegalensis]
MDRFATAVWEGGIKTGKGALTTETGALSHMPYSFSARFEDGQGTNPEELVAAGHAGCFTMDLSGRLERAGITGRIETRATLTLEKGEKGFAVTRIHLDVAAQLPGVDERAFQEAVGKARENCPISRLLDTEITVSARMA